MEWKYQIVTKGRLVHILKRDVVAHFGDEDDDWYKDGQVVFSVFRRVLLIWALSGELVHEVRRDVALLKEEQSDGAEERKWNRKDKGVAHSEATVNGGCNDGADDAGQAIQIVIQKERAFEVLVHKRKHVAAEARRRPQNANNNEVDDVLPVGDCAYASSSDLRL